MSKKKREEDLEMVEGFLNAHDVRFAVGKGPLGEDVVIIPLGGLAKAAERFGMMRHAMGILFDTIRDTNPLADGVLGALDWLLLSGMGKIPSAEDDDDGEGGEGEEVEAKECDHSKSEDHGNHMHCPECGLMVPKVNAAEAN